MLRGIRRLEMCIVPNHPRSTSVKSLYNVVTRPAVLKTNEECKVLANIDEGKNARPLVTIEWDNGTIETLQAENYHLHDLTQHINDTQKKAEIDEMLNSPLEPIEDKAIFDQAVRMAQLLGKQ